LPQPTQYEFRLIRPWEPGTTAIVHVTSAHPASEIKQRLAQALTAWAASDPDGLAALRDACGSFNIDNLSVTLGSNNLEKILVSHGLSNVCVQVCVIGPFTPNWEFDDELVDVDALPESIQNALWQPDNPAS